jgi:transglutaminase-like putative cysteine protease
MKTSLVMKKSLVLAFLALPALAAAPSIRQFHIEQTYTVPSLAGDSKGVLFFPVPPDDPWQIVSNLSIDGRPFEVVHDPKYGNAAARVEVQSGAKIQISFDVTRKERSAEISRATGKPAPDGYISWLGNDARVKVDDRIRKIAAEQTSKATTPLQKARAIYDYVLSTMRYEKKGEGWGNGDILWACDKKYGNCTDFHALVIGLLRASGIPARFQVGYSVPDGQQGEIPGYHCWADFYLDGVGWVAVDASEAWKHPEKRDYFFGHHDVNRFTLSTGRDVSIPGMRGQPLNFFVYPYVEVDAKAGPTVARAVRFTELNGKEASNSPALPDRATASRR